MSRVGMKEQLAADDGLGDAERKAHKACVHLACANEQCFKRYMYRHPKERDAKCKDHLAAWEACFARNMTVLSRPPPQ